MKNRSFWRNPLPKEIEPSIPFNSKAYWDERIRYAHENLEFWEVKRNRAVVVLIMLVSGVAVMLMLMGAFL